MEGLLRFIKRLIPAPLFHFFQPFYHLVLSYIGVLIYWFPSRKLYVIGITGTKGKSSTCEIINAILEDAGYTTALASTIRFKIGDENKRNLFKMTMPGRLFLQQFMRRAVRRECTHLVLEMTSEGVKQFRHKNIALDALIVTNLTPEHIESHGSFENYKAAKMKIRDALVRSPKREKLIITNSDDEHGKDFADADIPMKKIVSLGEVQNPKEYPHISFTYNTESYTSPLQGTFNIYNVLFALKIGEHLGIKHESMKKTLSQFRDIPGRVEYVNGGQKFKVVVDYAHTIDSLEKLYATFDGLHRVCVLGNTGGGRDSWKRPEMGKVADSYCDTVILTNEDPYDEDPEKIVNEMAAGMDSPPTIIMDRRKAIRHAFECAKEDSIVLITGKGTDPYIMGAKGSKLTWSDRDVALEELHEFLQKT